MLYEDTYGADEEQNSAAMEQLETSQRILDYDTKEFTIELLVQKFGAGGEDDDIFVPAYQRRFRWDDRRQSRFIESLLIGLPIPFLFFADIQDGRLEVVDGMQRLSTCKAFLNDELVLVGLERLSELDGFSYSNLPKAQQRRLRNRTIRSVVLSQKASEDDRRDLFDRINTGSLIAEPVETRRGSVMGPVTDLLDKLATDERFLRLCPMSEAARRKREGEELITRFFAFGDAVPNGLADYRDRISEFLKSWLQRANERALADPRVVEEYRERFHKVMAFVESYFPYGFRKKATSKATPRVRFDAIAVGVWLAARREPQFLRQKPTIDPKEWIVSDDFFELTTSSAANVRSRILNRTEYSQFMLMGRREEAAACIPSRD